MYGAKDIGRHNTIKKEKTETVRVKWRLKTEEGKICHKESSKRKLIGLRNLLNKYKWDNKIHD